MLLKYLNLKNAKKFNLTPEYIYILNNVYFITYYIDLYNIGMFVVCYILL
uniref:Uncharacterized protein n=1 Tax=Yersinia enterocolitica W22703 TaxID=913028 RepID=F4N6Z0_YEREN|nr:unknown protein [Yersinia enterocolitica W22703]